MLGHVLYNNRTGSPGEDMLGHVLYNNRTGSPGEDMLGHVLYNNPTGSPGEDMLGHVLCNITVSFFNYFYLLDIRSVFNVLSICFKVMFEYLFSH